MSRYRDEEKILDSFLDSTGLHGQRGLVRTKYGQQDHITDQIVNRVQKSEKSYSIIMISLSM